MKALKATLLLPVVLIVAGLASLPFLWEDLVDLRKELKE